MFTGPVGLAEVFFNWPEAIFGNLYWHGAKYTTTVSVEPCQRLSNMFSKPTREVRPKQLSRSQVSKSNGISSSRVIARILKMPVQKSNSKISARPDLATYLLQILIPTTFNSLLCQQGQFALLLFPYGGFVRDIFGYYPPKAKIEKFS